MEKANITFIKSAVLALFLSIVLTACGGGGGGGVTAGASGTGASGTGASGTGVVGAGTAAVTPSILSGIAATGAAIQGTVYLKDSAGTVKSQVIASDGSYSFDVTGLTPPFYLRAISNDSNIAPMHSVAMAPGRANINPITNVAVAAAARTADPGASYDNPATHPITQNSIETAIADIRRILDVVTRNERYNDSTAAAINQAMNINPLSDPFEANNQGFDRVLDDLKVNMVGGNVTFTMNGRKLAEAILTELNAVVPVTSEEVDAALAVRTVNSLTGAGNNTPHEATLKVDIDGVSDSLIYSFNNTSISSSSISSATFNGGVITIEGVGKVTIGRDEVPGYTFTATIIDGSTDAFGIVINDPNGNIYYNTRIDGSGAILPDSLTSGEGFTVNSLGNSVSGAGNNTPYEAALSVNISDVSDSLTYAFRNTLLISTSITNTSSIGGVVTIEGTGNLIVNRVLTPGYTYTATIIDGSTDEFGIVIHDPAGAIHYSTRVLTDPLTSGAGFEANLI